MCAAPTVLFFNNQTRKDLNRQFEFIREKLTRLNQREELTEPDQRTHQFALKKFERHAVLASLYERKPTCVLSINKISDATMRVVVSGCKNCSISALSTIRELAVEVQGKLPAMRSTLEPTTPLVATFDPEKFQFCKYKILETSINEQRSRCTVGYKISLTISIPYRESKSVDIKITKDEAKELEKLNPGRSVVENNGRTLFVLTDSPLYKKLKTHLKSCEDDSTRKRTVDFPSVQGDRQLYRQLQRERALSSSANNSSSATAQSTPATTPTGSVEFSSTRGDIQLYRRSRRERTQSSSANNPSSTPAQPRTSIAQSRAANPRPRSPDLFEGMYPKLPLSSPPVVPDIEEKGQSLNPFSQSGGSQRSRSRDSIQ